MNRPRLWIAVLLAAVIMGCLISPASAFRKQIAPEDSWSQDQKIEWYLGVIAEALKYCGHYSEASAVQELARLTPYGREGIQQSSDADAWSGGCARMQSDAKKVLEKASSWKAYLGSKYVCSGASCAEEDDALVRCRVPNYRSKLPQENPVIFMSRDACVLEGGEVLAEDPETKP